jgi:hypothetical protein
MDYEGAIAMLDYRYHYAVMATEDRLRATRSPVITPRQGARRIFRLGSGRTDSRDAARR